MTESEAEPSTVNELVLTHDRGFVRLEGPWSVEKEGTKWTVILPYDEMRTAPSTRFEGEGAVLIADCQAVGGGIVAAVFDPEDEGETHVAVDQYAAGADR